MGVLELRDIFLCDDNVNVRSKKKKKKNFGDIMLAWLKIRESWWQMLGWEIFVNELVMCTYIYFLMGKMFGATRKLFSGNIMVSSFPYTCALKYYIFANYLELIALLLISSHLLL